MIKPIICIISGIYCGQEYKRLPNIKNHIKYFNIILSENSIKSINSVKLINKCPISKFF
jgi:vacuolar-type H+-ATPase subunit D/Vma8